MTIAQLDSLVTLLRSRPGPEARDLAPARARFEKLADFLGGAPDAKCEKVDAGGVPAEWVSAPGSDPGRAILFLHGGGYAIGSINTHRVKPPSNYVGPQSPDGFVREVFRDVFRGGRVDQVGRRAARLSTTAANARSPAGASSTTICLRR